VEWGRRGWAQEIFPLGNSNHDPRKTQPISEIPLCL
jgi:hypothetical protein